MEEVRAVIHSNLTINNQGEIVDSDEDDNGNLRDFIVDDDDEEEEEEEEDEEAEEDSYHDDDDDADDKSDTLQQNKRKIAGWCILLFNYSLFNTSTSLFQIRY